MAFLRSDSQLAVETGAPHAPDEPSSYKYSPLRLRGSIRVIIVQGAEDASEEVRCHLVEVSITDPQSYTAISYAWEGQTPSRRIHCDGHALLVTVNCEAILRRFRPNVPGETCCLWIDGICIDQRSLPERCNQVAIMGQIYSTASRVMVWLGEPRRYPSSVSYRKQFSWLEQASSIAMREKGRSTPSTDALALLKNISDDLSHNALHAMFQFLPWFKRLWPLQEIVLAKDAVFVYGTGSVNFKSIRALSKLLLSLKSDIRCRDLYNILQRGLGVHLYVYDSHLCKQPFTLSVLGRLTTSEPQDKVFAIQGLLASAGLDLPDLNYFQTTSYVYRRLSQAFINFTGDLNLLKYSHAVNALPELPSWALSLNSSFLIDSIHSPDVAQFDHIRPEFDFADDGMGLICSGYLLDRVQSLSDAYLGITECSYGQEIDMSASTPPEWQKQNRSERSLSRRVRMLNIYAAWIRFSREESTSGSEQSGLTALYQCLRHLSRTWHNLEIIHEITFEKWAQLLCHSPEDRSPHAECFDPEDMSKSISIAKHKRNPELDHLTQTKDFDLLERIYSDRVLSSWHRHVSGRTEHTTVFRTESGRLGIGPSSIDSSDQIVYIRGSGCLLAIRWGVNGHTIIGSVYVHGILDDFDLDNEILICQQYTII